MSSSPQLLADLEAIVGPRGLVTDPDAMRSYEIGARYDEGRAALVVRPSDTSQVSAVVGLCVRSGVSLIPQGGNTGLVGASTPDGSGAQVVLSLDRLSDPLEVDATNRTVKVGAGASSFSSVESGPSRSMSTDPEKRFGGTVPVPGPSRTATPEPVPPPERASTESRISILPMRRRSSTPRW